MADAYRQAIQLHRAGRLPEAENIYRQILAADPTHAGATHLLGVVAHQAGRPRDALPLIQRAIALHASDAEYHNNLGEVWRALDRPDEAAAAYSAALRLQPGYAVARSNLGVVRMNQGRLDEAEQLQREALAARPDYAAAQFNLGCVLERRGQPVAALAAHRAALALRPDFPEAQLNIGQILQDAGRLDDAETAFRAALASASAASAASTNLGNVAKDRGDLDAAIEWYRHALANDPTNAVAHSNLAYAMLFHPQYDAQAQLAELGRFAEQQTRGLAPKTPARRIPDPARPLRLGYSSPFFSAHVVGWNLRPLLRHHDRTAFEIFCYSDVDRSDATTDEFRRLARHWRDTLGWSDDRLAAQVEEDRIDIFVDLTLHMAQNRLLAFARRPAPVQMTFAGYPGTTGLKAIQYRLTDEYLDPVTGGEPYPEESLRLRSFWCYQPRGDEPAVVAPPATSAGYITFGCLNNFCKVTGEVLGTWSQVMRAVPNSRLLLLSAPGPHRQRTLDLLAREGVVATRVEFLPRLDHTAYVQAYQRIDVVLDTFPYNGHTTSCDALFMGVPLVTLAGRTVVGRAGVSQLSNLGLPELIAHSQEEFVRVATALASDLPRLAELRATLRARMERSPLMDAAGFTRGIEAAYRQAWQRWCATAPAR